MFKIGHIVLLRQDIHVKNLWLILDKRYGIFNGVNCFTYDIVNIWDFNSTGASNIRKFLNYLETTDGHIKINVYESELRQVNYILINSVVRQVISLCIGSLEITRHEVMVKHVKERKLNNDTILLGVPSILKFLECIRGAYVQ